MFLWSWFANLLIQTVGDKPYTYILPRRRRRGQTFFYRLAMGRVNQVNRFIRDVPAQNVQIIAVVEGVFHADQSTPISGGVQGRFGNFT